LEEVEATINDLTDRRSVASRRLESARDAKGNKISGPKFEAFTRRAAELAQLETALRERQEERLQLMSDIQSDLSGSTQTETPPPTQPASSRINTIGGLPVVRTPEDIGRLGLKEGDRFYGPDPENAGKPILYTIRNGKLVEVIQ
jgi:hypothetical protein